MRTFARFALPISTAVLPGAYAVMTLPDAGISAVLLPGLSLVLMGGPTLALINSSRRGAVARPWVGLYIAHMFIVGLLGVMLAWIAVPVALTAFLVAVTTTHLVAEEYFREETASVPSN